MIKNEIVFIYINIVIVIEIRIHSEQNFIQASICFQGYPDRIEIGHINFINELKKYSAKNTKKKEIFTVELMPKNILIAKWSFCSISNVPLPKTFEKIVKISLEKYEDLLYFEDRNKLLLSNRLVKIKIATNYRRFSFFPNLRTFYLTQLTNCISKKAGQKHKAGHSIFLHLSNPHLQG